MADVAGKLLQVCELNTFFLKHFLRFPATHPFCWGRLMLIAVVAAPACRWGATLFTLIYNVRWHKGLNFGLNKHDHFLWVCFFKYCRTLKYLNFFCCRVKNCWFLSVLVFVIRPNAIAQVERLWIQSRRSACLCYQADLPVRLPDTHAMTNSSISLEIVWWPCILFKLFALTR